MADRVCTPEEAKAFEDWEKRQFFERNPEAIDLMLEALDDLRRATMKGIYAIANQKGGVGKTTTTESLAAALALYEDTSVLAVDYDPQCSLTKALDRDATGRVERGVGSGFDLLTGDPALAARDYEGVNEFAEEIACYRDEYDVILIDCPPSLSMVTMNALFAADHVIVPTLASYLAAVGIEELARVVATVNEQGAAIQDLRVLITMHERNGAVREMEQQIRAAWPTFKQVIRKNVTLSYAQASGYDVFTYDARSVGARDYRDFAHELMHS